MRNQRETMEKVTITPDKARRLLEVIDPAHYRWRKSNYRRILADMQADNFDSEASIPLVVDFDGRPWNGRHRFAAQVEAGKTYIYWLHVCSAEMAQRIQTVGDAPASWGVKDALKVRGETSQSDLSAALGYLHRFLVPFGVRSRQSPTASQALALLENNKEIREWMNPTSSVGRRLGISRGMCAATAYLTARMGVPEKEIIEFWTLMFNMSSPDPIKVAEAVSTHGSGPVAVFAAWIRNSEPKKGQILKRSEPITWAFLNMTWNAWITGRRLTLRGLKWDTDKQPFPGLCDAQGNMVMAGSEEARALLEPVKAAG